MSSSPREPTQQAAASADGLRLGPDQDGTVAPACRWCGGELVWPTGSRGRAGLDLRLTCSSCGWKRGAQPAPIPGEPLRIPVVLAYGALPEVEHPLTSALDGAGVDT